MVWGMIFLTDYIFVKTVSGRISSDTYIKLMKDTAIRLMRYILPDDFDLNKTIAVFMFQKKFGLL